MKKVINNGKELNYQYFMQVDIDEFSGEWIAVCEDRIIAHGKNLKEVVQEAKNKSGDKKFLLARVPSEETIIF